MKLKSVFTFLILSVVICGYAASENDILISASKKLLTLKTVKYHTNYMRINPMGVAERNDSATVFYNFNSNDKIIGVKYLFRNKTAAEGFNGTKSFFTIEEKKHLVYLATEDVNQLVGAFKDAFPIHILRKLLPQILDDKSIQCNRMNDTTINNVDCFRFKFNMHGKTIFMNRELMANENVFMTYVITIGKQDLLPRQFVNYFEDKSPILIVDYTAYDLSYVPDDLLFDCKLGYQNYMKYSVDEYSTVIREEIEQKSNSIIGTTVKDWTLPSLESDSIKLSKINAKVILLEFWFPGCPGRINIIPEINKLCHEYKPSDVQIFGVEFTKTDSTGLARYINKASIEYPTLYLGKELAKECRIMAAPALVLIDANRKVLYSRTGFKKNEIVDLVMNKLKFCP